MFKISDKVVCVDDSMQGFGESYIRGTPVEKGVVYVVESVVEGYEFYEEGCEVFEDGLFLVGMFRIWGSDGSDTPWGAARFRKLEDIKEENRKKQQEPQPV